MAIWKGSHNRILKGWKQSPIALLTTYPSSWDDPPRIGHGTTSSNCLGQVSAGFLPKGSGYSKKSPTGPTERTPQPEYLIALATYLGVRWDSGPFNFWWIISNPQNFELGLTKIHHSRFFFPTIFVKKGSLTSRFVIVHSYKVGPRHQLYMEFCGPSKRPTINWGNWGEITLWK